MTTTHEETLRQWLDPELGGTMPREVREAGLAVLAEVGRLRGEPQTLGSRIPDYWCEAKAKWPWLPATTERLDDEWRNRTRAENALWLIEQAEAKLGDIEEAHKSVMAEVCGGGPKDAVHCTCIPVLRAELKRLRTEVKRLRTAGIIMPSESSTAKMLDHWKGRADQAEERLAKAPETVFNTLAGTGDGDE